MINFTRRELAAFITAIITLGTTVPAIVAVPFFNNRTHASTPTATTTQAWKTAQLVSTIPSEAAALVISRDGQTLAGIDSKGVMLWDINTGKEIRTLEAQSPQSEPNDDDIRSVAISPDSQIVAGSNYNPKTKTLTIKLWQLKTGKLLKTLTTVLKPTVRVGPPGFEYPTYRGYGITFSPDGQTLASNGGNTEIQLWDIKTGVIRRTLRGNSIPIDSLAFSPNSQMLAVSGENTIKLWNTKTGQLIRTMLADWRILQVMFTPDGEKLLSTSGWGPPAEKVVQIWNPKTGKSIRQLRTFGRSTSVVFSPDGKVAANSGNTSHYQVVDLMTGETVVLLNDFGAKGMPIAFSPDGQTLAMLTGYSGGYNIKIWRKSGQ